MNTEGKEIRCDRCGRRARYIQWYSGTKLCDRCFTRSLQRRVFRYLRRTRALSDGDSIVFAVSGGKDSVACLDMVHAFERRRRVQMAVLTIDEGIDGYRPEGIEVAERAAKERDLEFHLVSFREEFGADLDSIIGLLASPKPACTYCGVLRRWLLNKHAREMGADKLVLGHNLDDEIQGAMLNLIRGDPARLAGSGTDYTLKDPRFVPRIKPLRRIPGKEILLYDIFRGLRVHTSSCPYSGYDMRNEIRTFFDSLEEKRPTSKSSFLSTVDRISERIRKGFSGAKLGRCAVCGEPTMEGRCKACQLLESVGLL